MQMSLKALLLALFCILVVSTDVHARAPWGKSIQTVAIDDRSIVVHVYRPIFCRTLKPVFVFAGFSRNADDYRDRTIPLATRNCLLVLAPELDQKRFPYWRYQWAGVWRDGRAQPKREWTGKLLAGIVAWGRKWSGHPDAPYFLFGHSAGGQFLSRIAAYQPPPGVARIVIANPSAHVLPSAKELAPYGFSGLPKAYRSAAKIRRYLALPITIYLAEDDRGQKRLVKDKGSMRQGPNRYERGLFAYRQARRIAREKSWPFGWRLVIVPNVGHSSSRMLISSQAEKAFGL